MRQDEDQHIVCIPVNLLAEKSDSNSPSSHRLYDISLRQHRPGIAEFLCSSPDSTNDAEQWL
jgi:hypothetical protein